MNNIPITIYTDGSSLGNPGKGGWAAVLSAKGKKLELSGGYRNTTNNRMELMGVINALKALKEPCSNVTIFTDSRYIADAINLNWLTNWMKRNWIKADKKPVLNVDLWKELAPLLELHKITFVWVEGHTGVSGNERCDVLCKAAAENATTIDIEYENSVSN
jgi:ribonuclease HI